MLQQWQERLGSRKRKSRTSWHGQARWPSPTICRRMSRRRSRQRKSQRRRNRRRRLPPPQHPPRSRPPKHWPRLRPNSLSSGRKRQPSQLPRPLLRRLWWMPPRSRRCLRPRPLPPLRRQQRLRHLLPLRLRPLRRKSRSHGHSEGQEKRRPPLRARPCRRLLRVSPSRH